MASALLLGVDPTPYLRSESRVERLLWGEALNRAWDRRNEREADERGDLAKRLAASVAGLFK